MDLDRDDPLFEVEYLESIRLCRLDIDAADFHINWLKDSGANEIEISIAKNNKDRLVEKLDKLMGLR